MENKGIKVVVDYTKGIYRVIGESNNKVFVLEEPIRGFDEDGLFKANFSRKLIIDRKKQIQDRLKSIQKKNSKFRYSRKMIDKVDTVLFKVLEDVDSREGTNYADSYLMTMVRKFEHSKDFEYANYLSKDMFEAECRRARKKDLESFGIDISYNVGLVNTSKSLSIIDRIRGIRIAKAQKYFLGVDVQSSFKLKRNYYLNDINNFMNDIKSSISSKIKEEQVTTVLENEENRSHNKKKKIIKQPELRKKQRESIARRERREQNSHYNTQMRLNKEREAKKAFYDQRLAAQKAIEEEEAEKLAQEQRRAEEEKLEHEKMLEGIKEKFDAVMLDKKEKAKREQIEEKQEVEEAPKKNGRDFTVSEPVVEISLEEINRELARMKEEEEATINENIIANIEEIKSENASQKKSEKTVLDDKVLSQNEQTSTFDKESEPNRMKRKIRNPEESIKYKKFVHKNENKKKTIKSFSLGQIKRRIQAEIRYWKRKKVQPKHLKRKIRTPEDSIKDKKFVHKNENKKKTIKSFSLGQIKRRIQAEIRYWKREKVQPKHLKRKIRTPEDSIKDKKFVHKNENKKKTIKKFSLGQIKIRIQAEIRHWKRKIRNSKDSIRNKKYKSHLIKNGKKILIKGFIGLIVAGIVVGGVTIPTNQNEFGDDNSEVIVVSTETSKQDNNLDEHKSSITEEKDNESKAEEATSVVEESSNESKAEETTPVVEENNKETKVEESKAENSSSTKTTENNNETIKEENSTVKEEKSDEEKIEEFKETAMKKYRDAIVIGKTPEVGDIFADQTYSQNPDGTGGYGYFANHPDYSVQFINIITNDGWNTINIDGKNLSELLAEYPDYITYNFHVIDSKGGWLGFVTQDQYEKLIQNKINKIIESKTDKNVTLDSNEDLLR